jgi:hypothetical protein
MGLMSLEDNAMKSGSGEKTYLGNVNFPDRPIGFTALVCKEHGSRMLPDVVTINLIESIEWVQERRCL